MNNLEQRTSFEIQHKSEAVVESFFQLVQAKNISLEWGWNTVVIGHEDDQNLYQGFGQCYLPKEQLFDLAQAKGIELLHAEIIDIDLAYEE